MGLFGFALTITLHFLELFDIFLEFELSLIQIFFVLVLLFFKEIKLTLPKCSVSVVII